MSWCGIRDSNPGQTGYKPGALTTELMPQIKSILLVCSCSLNKLHKFYNRIERSVNYNTLPIRITYDFEY